VLTSIEARAGVTSAAWRPATATLAAGPVVWKIRAMALDRVIAESRPTPFENPLMRTGRAIRAALLAALVRPPRSRPSRRRPARRGSSRPREPPPRAATRRRFAKLVASDRTTAYEAAERLFDEGTPEALALAESIAARYAASFHDASLSDRVALFRSFGPSQLDRRRRALALKKESIAALGEGRAAESLAGFEGALADFRELGDLREVGDASPTSARCSPCPARPTRRCRGFRRPRRCRGRAGDVSQLAAVLINRAYVLDRFSARSGGKSGALLEEALSIAR